VLAALVLAGAEIGSGCVIEHASAHFVGNDKCSSDGLLKRAGGR
jgi:carbonic anhydrase/acetyltransferase-like protein (isoleucine patch superfamily)